MISARLPIIQALAGGSGLLPAQVAILALTAPLRYKSYTIKKKNGGVRVVSQPAREIKSLQNILKKIIEPRLPFHDSIAAYRPGDSIKKNALRHSNSKYLLKMDLTNFFPSVTEDDLRMHFNKHLEPEFGAAEIEAIVHICCKSDNRERPLKLCIGAPSSPWLSNSILFDIDCALHDATAALGVAYSRYADDLTFSCLKKHALSEVPEIVEKILNSAEYPRLEVNRDKTIHASRASNRTVTGIVITPQGVLSVGREMKRKVRSMHHRWVLGKLTEDQIEQLNGLLSFIESVEPGFRLRLLKSASLR
ncbi:retron St85 family RNA-directed DNA polymerase [Stenotrophomonas maltophilia]|uniref:retron St85 family RNA-directed DNA polymerase n=1 Tax=Stenotrophomonas maltophilia TaxID=40324 RepID=UPI003B9F9D69